MVLYHPEDPKRRQFIDEVIRFHEEKGQPLKGPPMFAQAPLDLYMLYHQVKNRNGMNEVYFSLIVTVIWVIIESAENVMQGSERNDF